jgi:hypothetical protein
MSNERHTPLLSPAQAATLLDQVIYEQVLECIDLDALYRLEQSITMMVGEIDGISDDRICDTATAMLDRALLRLPGDVRRYLRAANWPAQGDCELCEEEARTAHQAPVRHPPTRLKS